MKRLRKIVFWTHLIAGVSTGLIILSMSFTGFVLMYEPQISGYSERRVRWVTPSPDGKQLSYDELIAKFRVANPEARPAMIMVKSDRRASVSINLGRDNTVFINPYNGEIFGASRRRTISCAISSTGTAGSAAKAKAAPWRAPSPACAI